MPETPHHVRDKVDTTIDGLNARWDLQLPRLHGPAARAAEGQHSLAKMCSAKIRYLCFRPVNLNRLTDEFEVRARQLFSDWVWKPSQERGTLPTLPVTKSFVDRDLRSKSKSGVVHLTDTQRQELLRVLHLVIDDDYQLARTTDAYERKDGPPPVVATSHSTRSSYHTSRESPTPIRQSTMVSEAAGSELDEPQMKWPLGKSAKRSLSSPLKVIECPQICHRVANFYPRTPNDNSQSLPS